MAFQVFNDSTSPALAGGAEMGRAAAIAEYRQLTTELARVAARAGEERERLEAAVQAARTALLVAEQQVFEAAERAREARHDLTLRRDRVEETLRRTCPPAVRAFAAELDRLYHDVGQRVRIEERAPFVVDKIRAGRVGTAYSNRAGVDQALAAIVALRTEVRDRWALDLVDGAAADAAVTAARAGLPLAAADEFLAVA